MPLQPSTRCRLQRSRSGDRTDFGRSPSVDVAAIVQYHFSPKMSRAPITLPSTTGIPRNPQPYDSSPSCLSPPAPNAGPRSD